MSSFFTSLFSDGAGGSPRSSKGRSANSKDMKRSANMMRGEELIKCAVMAEPHSPAEALRLYKDALAVWVEIMRVETDEKKKEDLSRFIGHYMQRAEVMKAAVDNKKTPSEFKNYTQPTASSTRKAGNQPRQSVQPRVTLSGRQRIAQPAAKNSLAQQQQPPQLEPPVKDNEYETQMMSELLDSSPGVR